MAVRLIGEADVLAYCQQYKCSLSDLHDEALVVLTGGHPDPQVVAGADRIHRLCTAIEERQAQERIQREFIPYDGCPKCGGMCRYAGGKHVYTTEYCPDCRLYTREWVMVKGVMLSRWTTEDGKLWLPQAVSVAA